ncbi:MAG: hypothetical protein DRO88_12550 [Promethearchaeia archaeon]|nr:MAG: hypothetical protein DRO88_12550 [Candidatus Lokiarchaeia archaeon]
MSSANNFIEFRDPLIKRNYHLIRHYFLFLIDIGLDYLKREYINYNSESSFQEFTANNYYDYILKDYLRRKLKGQLKIILNASVEAVEQFPKEKIGGEPLDRIVKKNYPEYAENDMSLLHSSPSHINRKELETISRLTFRVAIIQITRIMRSNSENVKTYAELIRSVYPEKIQCQTSLQAILTMIDKMIDCFERSLDLIAIPFYKPTWNLRDFAYIRRMYEFAITEANHQIDLIYQGELP